MYNYLEKTARVVFGPDLVILNPHENFNVLSLSGKICMLMYMYVVRFVCYVDVSMFVCSCTRKTLAIN